LRYLGKQQGNWNRQATRQRTRASNAYQPKVGTCFVATVIDDYSRVAYAECHDDATAATAAGVLYRSENARRAALAGGLHQYNHHRPHSAIGKHSPITRLDNLAEHHI
jgi:transposase InsO family protein